MSTTPDDIHYLDALELGQLISVKKLTCVDATRAILKRITELNPRLKAYELVDASGALKQAEQLDAELAADKSRGKLHGVPVAVKDLCDVEGLPTVAGMHIRRDVVEPAKKDAPVVTRLRAQGCVILGKLQLTEGAYSEHHPQIPPPVNPWEPDRWTGVSSSGSGVATAAGLTFASLGSDTLGSIRFPSTMCGLTGLKPTWGRVPRAGVFPLSPSLDHIGPMCRSAKDCAAVLAAIAGSDVEDPTAAQVAVPDYLGELSKGVKGLKIGVDRKLISSRAHAEMAAGVFAAADVFREQLGAHVVDIEMPPLDPAAADGFLLCASEVAVVHESTYPSRASEYGPALTALIETGRQASGAEITKLHIRRDEFRGSMDTLLSTVDFILLPAMDRPTLTNAERAAVVADPSQRANRVLFTAPIDVSGHPSLTIPGGKTGDGLPFGFQIIGKRFGEDVVLRAGHAFQGVTDWHKARPTRVEA